jgi:hypothetical protein
MSEYVCDCGATPYCAKTFQSVSPGETFAEMQMRAENEGWHFFRMKRLSKPDYAGRQFAEYQQAVGCPEHTSFFLLRVIRICQEHTTARERETSASPCA